MRCFIFVVAARGLMFALSRDDTFFSELASYCVYSTRWINRSQGSVEFRVSRYVYTSRRGSGYSNENPLISVVYIHFFFFLYSLVLFVPSVHCRELLFKTFQRLFHLERPG